MLKKLNCILLVLFITLMQIPSIHANASTVTKELKVSSELTQWVLDEPTNTLYAISEAGKNLMFINSTTMTVEKTLAFSEGPTDIIKDDGKLYIALDKAKQIAVVDMSSRTIVETINTALDPYRIVKDGDKVYYTQFRDWCYIYEYNLTSRNEKFVPVGSLSEPDIAIDPVKDILYVGESGSSGSELIYYSIARGEIIGKSNYDNGHGFLFPKRNIIFDGTNLYFAGIDFSSEDPTRFNGDFASNETVIYVNNGLVYTNKSIYNKDTHAKLGDYGYEASLAEASSNTLYIYNKNTGSIKSYNDSNKVINSSNIIALISGNPAVPVQTAFKSVKINPGMSTLEMNSKLVEWVLDEPSNTLFAISRENKALFFIDAKTLDLEKSLTFASSPTDIIVDQGKIYVALDDANQIVIIDAGSRTITGRLYTSSDPYRLVKGGDKIYYTEYDQHCYVYEYNLKTNTDRQLLMKLPQWMASGSVYQPDIAINTEDNILYVGESSGTGSRMFYYSLVDDKVIGITNYDNGNGFKYPERTVLFDGEKVYYAGFSFDKNDPNRIIGTYDDEVKFVKYGVAFTKTGVYDTNSNTLVQQTGGGIDLYEVAENGASYYYSKQDNAILFVDPSEMPLVQFNSNGGSAVAGQIVVGASKAVKPASPTRPGYNFGGWYTDQYAFTKPFDFNSTVTNDLNLYARWISTEAYIISYLQQTKDTKLFGIYNQAKAVIYESDLSEAKKGYYLGQLAQYDKVVFTDINKYFINRCIDIAASPNLTDFLALVDEIDAKLTNEIDKGYFKGEMNSWGRYRVYTPEVQASIDAIVQVWTLKTPESVDTAKAAIATVKEAGSVSWLNARLDEAVQAISK